MSLLALHGDAKAEAADAAAQLTAAAEQVMRLAGDTGKTAASRIHPRRHNQSLACHHQHLPLNGNSWQPPDPICIYSTIIQSGWGTAPTIANCHLG